MVSLVLSAQAQKADNTAQNADNNRSRQEVRKYPKVKTGKKKKIADQLIKQGSYYNAVEYLEDILKDKPDNLKTIHQLAELNRSLRDYKASEKYYKIELEKDAKKWPNDKFFLGQMQKMNGKYDEAKKTSSGIPQSRPR